jgi:hypothetical protein
MPITIYGIKNCDTTKKARAWLDKRGADYAFRDYEIAGTSGRCRRQRRYGIPRMVAASGIMLAERWNMIHNEPVKAITTSTMVKISAIIDQPLSERAFMCRK